MNPDPFEAAMGEAFPGTARRVLARLMAAGYLSGSDRMDCCFYCGEMVAVEGSEHAPDCPWVEAVTLFGDPALKGSPRGVLKA